MDAKRRRNGTLLAVVGLVLGAGGLVALTLTDPVVHRDAGEPRIWAVSCAFLGLGVLVSGLVMRTTAAPPPLKRPRRYWLVLAGVGLALLVGTAAMNPGAADWRLYVPGGYLMLVSLASWLYEHVTVRRRRDAEGASGFHDAGDEVTRGPERDGTPRARPPARPDRTR